MNGEFKYNLAAGAIRGLYAQNLITEEQMDLAVQNLRFAADKKFTEEGGGK